MPTNGVLVDCLLLAIMAGFTARQVSDYLGTFTSLRDSSCGYKRNSHGDAVLMDPKKETSWLCTLATCQFCQCGWLTLYFVPVIGAALGMTTGNLFLVVATWLASWRFATSLPE